MFAKPLAVLVLVAGAQTLLALGLDNITNGMSRAEVTERMGLPKGVMANATDEILLFADATITLHKGKVSSVNLSPHGQQQKPPPPGTDPVPTSPPPATPAPADGDVAWQTDFAKAAADAAQTRRYLLLDFTGSDWCGFCVKLEKEVFSTPEFATFASRFVCVRLDFPRKQPQPAELKMQNAGLAATYAVHSYPTVLLLAPNGKLVGSQTGYRGTGVQKYIEQLNTMISAYEQRLQGGS